MLWQKIRRKIRSGEWKEIWKEIRWIFRYIVKYRNAVIFYILIGVASTLIGLAGSVTSKYAIDAVTQFDIRLLVMSVALFAVTGFGSIFLDAFMNRMLTKISLRINKEILEDVYYKILDTRWEEMSRYHSGDLLNRLNSDVSAVSGSVLSWVPSLIIRTVHFLGSLFIILYYDPVMGVLALGSAPVTVLFSRVLLYRMRDFNKKMRQASSDLMGFTSESFQNIQSIKSFHLTDLFRNRLDRVQGSYIENALEYNEFSVKTSIVMSSLSLVISFLCMGWGVYRLWTGYITYGTMTMFLQLSRTLASDFSTLVKMVPSAISATTSAGRIMEVTDLPKDDHEDEAVIRRLEEEADRGLGITLDNIFFSYSSDKDMESVDDERVLEGCSLQAAPGEIVALIGRSGCGKTTLLRIILGLIRQEAGTAEIWSGSGVRASLGAGSRHLISYVPQGNTLFSGTIEDNLKMIAPDADREEMEEALKIACAWDFVQKLPGKMQCLIGEKGTGLSEGQAQRISIARAVLKKAPIILFDEATSALDEETGEKILENIKTTMKNCTCVMVSHRPTSLKICSKVYRLENCRLTEEKASHTTALYSASDVSR